MRQTWVSGKQLGLLAGDVTALGLATLAGFASHNTLLDAGSRMLTTFLPLVFAWLLIAPFLGVYDLERVHDPRQLWRPFWAMVLAGPMAAWMRGVLLNSPILPVFVVVLGGTAALSLLVWRSLYWVFVKRKAGQRYSKKMESP